MFCEAIQECRHAAGKDALSDDDLLDALAIWTRVLAAVPTGTLKDLVTATIQRKGGYPVTAGDIFETWNAPQKARGEEGRSWLSETWHAQMGLRTEAEEDARRRSFQESERARRQEAMERNRYFEELEQRGELENNMPSWSDIFDLPEGGPEGSAEQGKSAAAAESSTSRLLERLRIQCNMDTTNREQAIAFGCWLLDHVPVEEWSPELAAQQWTIWQQGKVAA